MAAVVLGGMYFFLPNMCCSQLLGLCSSKVMRRIVAYRLAPCLSFPEFPGLELSHVGGN